MGHSITDGQILCTKEYSGLVSQVMPSLYLEPEVSGADDNKSETLYPKNSECSNVHNTGTDQPVISIEVRHTNIDESENDADVYNRVEAGYDSHRLLPDCVQDECSSQEGESLLLFVVGTNTIRIKCNILITIPPRILIRVPENRLRHISLDFKVWVDTVIPIVGGSYDINELVQSLHGEESSLSIISQVSLPFLIAGYGTVGAGLVLDIVQHWAVFKALKEIFILVPALLGLKGNLEMTLASRLSTQANLGNMDTKKEVIKMVCGNISLVQAQAIVVGFLSAVTAMVFGWIPKGEFNFNHGLLLCAASLFTAAASSFILSTIMVIVVLLSRYFRINPDNVATPIAASLGDLVTLTVLSWVGNLLYQAPGKYYWLAPVIILFFLLLLPLWVIICIKNKYTDDVIFSGWVPVVSAMLISSVGGLILQYAVSKYVGIAAFQPIINGVGGNIVAIHASRISTSLHLKGRLRGERLKGCLNIYKVFFGPGVHSRAARILTFLTIPGHLLFSYTLSYMGAGHTSITVTFECFYQTAALLQVTLLIYISTWLVPLIWVRGSDPDNVAIPYLTAIGDLMGTGLLAAAFHLLYLVGDRDADVAD